jgi:predicted enzyme related to lactoylglutathione lyase
MKNTINWFEIPVNDMPRAIDFYENMLGVELRQETMDGIQMALFPFDEKSVSGCLVKADFMQPSGQGSLVYLNVEGFMDEAMERATAQGSEIAFPKTAIGENGFIAHLSDSEGNKIALHSMSA